jgi:ferredoxin
MKSFPGDGDSSVCPTGAVSWPLDSNSGPTVVTEACTGCGICVQRCPAAAIQLGHDGIAIVFDNDTPTLKVKKSGDAVATRANFERATRERRIAVASDESLARVAARIFDIGGQSGPRFPNLVARNLLVALGWSTAMRRAGDTNVRMDLLAQRDGLLCVTEVEFSDAVIDAPRSVLDGLAVLRGRYGVPAEFSAGLVVVGALPNQRSEYWHVMSDIEKTLGVRLHTATAGSLVLLVWEGAQLRHLPFASLGAPSIRSDIEKNLGTKLGITLGEAAALEAAK